MRGQDPLRAAALDRVKHLYEVENMSVPDIAIETGFSVNYLYRIANTKGFKRGAGYNQNLQRSQAMQKLADEKAAQEVPILVNRVEESAVFESDSFNRVGRHYHSLDRTIETFRY